MNIQRITLHILIAVLILGILAACQTNANNLETMGTSPNLDNFTRLSVDAPLIEDESRNCTINSLEAKEEGWHAAGSTGGLALDYPNSPATPVVSPSIAANGVSSASNFGTFHKNVAILIVDDFKSHEFRGGVYQLDPALFDLSLEDLTISEGQSPEEALGELLDGYLASGKLSHGALVFNHTIALVDAMPGTALLSQHKDRVDFSRDGKRIVIQALDTEGFNTRDIKRKLESSITRLANPSVRGEPSIKHFSVNMSFAIVPCDVLEDFRNSTVKTFEEYIERLASRNGYSSFANDILDLAHRPNEQLLRGFAAEAAAFTGAEAVVFAASAGNYGHKLNYPLAPAAWEMVVSSSSLNRATQIKSDFSNPGEVMTMGAWFMLTDPIGLYNEGEPADALVYAGTSFSSPGVAVALAFDLAQRTPDCQTPHASFSELAYGSFDDLLLRDAISQHCL